MTGRRHTKPDQSTGLRTALAAVTLACIATAVCAPSACAQNATDLKGHHAALRESLANNVFGRPLVLNSFEATGQFRGEVYAVVMQPFGVVASALQTMDQWCDVLMLHLNVKSCRARGEGAASVLSVAVGSRFDQPLADAYRVDFAYRVAARESGYLEVLLNADAGPLGTKDYRIVFEAIPIDAKSSFVHMSYAYRYGLAARLAMQGYLATIGRNKVGFSVTGREADGAPIYIGNVRGVVERNTMRYYLAIEAFLGAYALPTAQQPEQRRSDWFAAIERYPRQLHEMERADYMAMKRRESLP